MGRFLGTIEHFPRFLGVVASTLGGFAGTSIAQSGGFSGISPVSVFDPLYGPTTDFPHGQHWIPTTKVDFAWALVGYDYYSPPPVDFNNPNTTIAIIDSGIDVDHIEFGGPPGTPGSKVNPESTSILEDLSDGSPVCDCDVSLFADQPPEDVQGTLQGGVPHGTILSGIAAANVNGQGMAGVCWECDLLVIRVFAVAFSGSCGVNATLCQQNEDTVAASIRYAAGWNGTGYNTQPRARIISMSIGDTEYDGIACDGNTIADAIDEAYDQGCIIVVAVGNAQGVGDCWVEELNDPRCTPQPGFVEQPITNGLAINPKTIGVGGACLYGDSWHCRSMVNPLVSDFDDCCPAPNGVNYCDAYDPFLMGGPEPRLPIISVVAPMVDTFSTWGDGVVGTSNDDFQLPGDGNSSVPPQVAGIIALMLKADPDLTFDEVKHILEVTATDITNSPATSGYDRHTGYGLVNARAALEYVLKMGLPADWNGDGDIGPIDPVLYVADYAAGDPMTDLDLDTTQTADDMTIFIDSYNNGGN